MSGTTDWERWHAPYDDLSSPLSQRLAVIQTQHRNMAGLAAAGA